MLTGPSRSEKLHCVKTINRKEDMLSNNWFQNRVFPNHTEQQSYGTTSKPVMIDLVRLGMPLIENGGTVRKSAATNGTKEWTKLMRLKRNCLQRVFDIGMRLNTLQCSSTWKRLKVCCAAWLVNAWRYAVSPGLKTSEGMLCRLAWKRLNVCCAAWLGNALDGFKYNNNKYIKRQIVQSKNEILLYAIASLINQVPTKPRCQQFIPKPWTLHEQKNTSINVPCRGNNVPYAPVTNRLQILPKELSCFWRLVMHKQWLTSRWH